MDMMKLLNMVVVTCNNGGDNAVENVDNISGIRDGGSSIGSND